MANAIEITISTIDKVSDDLSKISTRFSEFGKNLKAVGQTLTTSITLPIAAAMAGVLKSAIDFESAFAGVRKTVDATEEQFGTLRDGIQQMAKELPASTTEISRVAEAAGQLGIRTESLLTFSKVMIDLGNTTNLSSDAAATALARLANITQMPQENFDRLGATVVELGNKLAATEAEIVEMGLRLAGAGKQVGLTEAQMLGFAGALSSVGIDAEAGGSAISRAFINIASAVATGDEKVQLLAKTAGMSAQNFAKAFKDDAAGAMLLFIEGLGKMGKAGENIFGVLDQLEMSDIRLRDAILRAANAGDLFRESLEIGTKAWAENTALVKEAEQRYATTASQLVVFWNKLKDVAITLGTSLTPALIAALDAAEPFLKILASLAEGFAGLDPTTQKIIITLGLFVAAIGPVLLVVSAVAMVIAALATPVGLASAAIAVLIAELMLLPTQIEVVRGLVMALGNAFKTYFVDKFEDAVNYLKGKIEVIKGYFQGLYDFVVGHSVVPDMVDGVISEFGRMGEESVGKLGIITEGFSEINGEIIASSSATTDTLGGLWKKYQDSLGTQSQQISSKVIASYDTMITGFGNAVAQMVVYGGSFGEFMEATAKQILADWISMGVEMIANYLFVEESKTAIMASETALRTGIEIAAAIKSVLLAFASVVKIVALYAYEAAAAAYAAISAIPIVGPFLAPAVAVATLAAVMAYTPEMLDLSGIAHGGLTNVPSEGTYLLNDGERVLSPRQNQDLTEFMDSGGGGVSINELHLFSGASIDEALLSKPQSWWVKAVESNILPALNTLGGHGASTSLQYRRARA